MVNYFMNLYRQFSLKLIKFTEGTIIIENGPSFLETLNFISSSRAIIIAGRMKRRVLPDPVNAIDIISLPDRTTGKPCICIGVG